MSSFRCVCYLHLKTKPEVVIIQDILTQILLIVNNSLINFRKKLNKMHYIIWTHTNCNCKSNWLFCMFHPLTRTWPAWWNLTIYLKWLLYYDLLTSSFSLVLLLNGFSNQVPAITQASQVRSFDTRVLIPFCGHSVWSSVEKGIAQRVQMPVRAEIWFNSSPTFPGFFEGNLCI